ncbi:glycosyl transferase [Clavibacter sp. VKM Ac-2873]|uniref:nucleotide disphospho-sugar-binding domain-containing protein n=1 Tax=Clavibacter sp. VKM Ac-2873 TaxID=2783813 RepID=UPI00188C8FB1|nr:nucleotide disphospho-sugar-binding domain-containing protein [Clavibacter sp. VKM Ac-2873]MBF4618721.1 glycosyl transferase [Clavibacter sp. VKM Ac-2873]
MSSYLLCAPPIYGHLAPLVAIGRGLVARGADVTLLTGAKYREVVIEAGLTFAALPADVDFDDAQLDGLLGEANAARGVAAIRTGMIAMFVRVIPGQHRALLALLEQGRFDAVLSESAFTGVAPYVELPRADRLPVLGLATTPVTLTSVDAAPFGAALPPGRGPLGHLRDRALTAAIRPGLTRPLRRAVDAVLAEIGAAPSRTDTFDFPYLSFDELFQLSVSALEYPRRELPDTVRFVGPLRPATGGAHDAELPDWWPDLVGDRPVVHVTQGTIDNVDLGRLVVPTLRALADEDVLVIASTGGRPLAELERALDGPLPANARVAEFLPHDLLLPLCSAVVTNGGFGGVQRTLAHGVPLVVAGSTEDKPEVAARVAWAGCGKDLRTGKPRQSAIRSAVRDVLSTPSYRARSRELATAIAALPDPLDVIAAGLDAAVAARRGPSATHDA